MFVKAMHQPYHLNNYNNVQQHRKNTLDQDSLVPYSLENDKTDHFKTGIAGGVLLKNNDIEANIAEKRMIDQLQGRDAEVRAHEHAHLAAAGGVATSGPKYIFMRGPNGRLYAVGGEVSIDTSPIPGNPEKTIQKAQKLRRAALSPANPSGQDLRVAAAATRMEQQARAELAKEKQEKKAKESVNSTDRNIHGSLLPTIEQIRGEDPAGDNIKEDDELRPLNVMDGGVRENFLIPVRFKDLYTEQAAGNAGESNQLINVLA